MQLNVIAGLPRSGSTLLCNVLNQNPRFYASSTSPVASAVNVLGQRWSNSPEIVSELALDREGTEAKVKQSMRGVVKGWYHSHRKKIIFDKNRGWGHLKLLLQLIYPNSKLVMTVRDLREVFASMEKQHRKTALFGTGPGQTMETRLVETFSPKGMIGSQVAQIRDAMQRGLDVHFFHYERFCKQPEIEMERLYAFLGEEIFNHDFENVVSTATDLDALYHNKFPHVGSGKVEIRSQSWQEYMSVETGARIVNEFGWFYKTFYPEMGNRRRPQAKRRLFDHVAAVQRG